MRSFEASRDYIGLIEFWWVFSKSGLGLGLRLGLTGLSPWFTASVASASSLEVYAAARPRDLLALCDL